MDNLWADIADRVKELSSKPEKFLEPSETIFEKTKVLAKVLYDTSKLYEDGKFCNVTLPELIIDSFDEEQVWAGVELQNTAWENEFRFKLEKFETLSIRNPDCFNLLRGEVPKSGFEPVLKDDSEADNEDFDFDDDDDGDDDEMDEQDGEVCSHFIHFKAVCMNELIKRSQYIVFFTFVLFHSFIS